MNGKDSVADNGPGDLTSRSNTGNHWKTVPAVMKHQIYRDNRWKLLDALLLFCYRWDNRYARKIIREVLLSRKGAELYSRTVRKLFLQYHHIDIGLYSYGGFTLDLPPGTVIGRYTSWPRNLLVINGSHPTNFKSHHPFFFNSELGYTDELLIKRRSTLTIGNDVYIGLNVIIMPSVTKIGDGAVIGAGSVVIKDIPPFSIAMGNPARVLKMRFSPETIAKIVASRWWEKDIDELKADEREFAGFLEPLE
jgi:virginiamycin A acetyltransferase